MSKKIMNNKLSILNVISWIFGIIFFAIGVVNTFWGNDQGFGVFVILLSLAYFPPIINNLTEKTNFKVPRIIKVLMGIFIIWAALGVGEFFDKIDLMLMSINY